MEASRLAQEHADEDAVGYGEFEAEAQVDAELDLGELDEDDEEDRYLQLFEESYEHRADAGYEPHFLRFAEDLDETREDRANDLAEDQAQRELDRAGQQCEVAS